MPEDIKYHNHSEDAFEDELLRADAVLSGFVKEPVKIFRPPSARSSKAMNKVLEKHGYISVLGDIYANDVTINDPDWSSDYICKSVKPGSIIIVHMPQKNFRHWALKEIELTLKKLTEQGYKVVNFSYLHNQVQTL
eukprot:UN34304